MSNVNKWSPWYKGIKHGDPPRPYGTTDAYRLGAEWLKECKVVEDWGCGMGFFRTVRPEGYVGVDGTPSPFADRVVDLALYRSHVPGIFMRGVIEHDWRWWFILDNAVRSFTKRMCLVIFTPFGDETKQCGWTPEIEVPDISFRQDDLMRVIQTTYIAVRVQDIESDTAYGRERIFYLEKRTLRRPT